MKFLTKILIIGLGLMLSYPLIIMVFGLFTEFKPPLLKDLKTENQITKCEIDTFKITISTWNIGYAGLGKESNFFYDKGNPLLSKGRMVYAPEQLNNKNWNGVKHYFANSQADFFLIQEIDQRSKRSYFKNQFEELQTLKKDYAGCIAINYSNPRVPIPLLEPWKAYGKVLSGLATYSRFQPNASQRIQLPGSYPFPDRIFQLQRCLLVQEFDWLNAKLLLVNLHNAAYDPTGEIKEKQLAFIRSFLLDKYEQGYYVIVGGDWNQCPPDFGYDQFSPSGAQGYIQYNIEEDFLPKNWQWVYDKRISTNRKTAYTYQKGKTFETIIDFFLISPNLKLEEIQTIEQGFEFSDHQPVEMTVSPLSLDK